MKNPFIVSFVCHCIFLILCLELPLDTKKNFDKQIKSEQSFDVSLNAPQKKIQKPLSKKPSSYKKTPHPIVKKLTKAIPKKSKFQPTPKPIQKPTPQKSKAIQKPIPTHQNHTEHINNADNTQFTNSIMRSSSSLTQEHNINKSLHTVTQKTIEHTGSHFNKEDYIADAKRRIANHKFYPNSAKRRGIEGRVGLKISINPNGTLMSVHITHSSGSTILDDAALSAVHAASPFKTMQKTLTFDCGIQFFLHDNE